MKKFSVVIILLMSVLLVACQSSKEDLVFIGEDKNWSSTVTVHQTVGDETYQIELIYQGNNLQEVESFTFEVESKSDHAFNYSDKDASLNNEGIYQDSLPISNAPSITEKDELVLQVEWNGEQEEFTLRNE